MPRLIITGGGRTVEMTVADKSAAIREISARLQREYSREAVEKTLNKWLSTRMTDNLILGSGIDTVSVQYRD